ncbi:PREDICTED: uncharacterized protein LOC106746118 isoform X2 [Dinoponera quadriceps]|uniref:Uncharacterized protein LOC106746118 isoform X2 n=1 Tax=Dinoponera quadriceps TaxID=609295 RepID=A0A6P3XIK6_DINQU|nr:PREDICTED: uncharacterized protein LOC106746118 isoform X2 [Dinoponera quadriceps]
MLRIMTFLLGAWLDVILCDTELSENQISSCRNPPLCDLSDESRNAFPFYSRYYAAPANHLRRSYYSGFGSSPAHYHTFDPISVLASLAFLAFLLQSFASLYDRSRSMLPTIVSGRRQSSDLTIPDEISRRALRDYESLDQNLDTIE